MTDTRKPDFPKPSPGDTFVVVQRASKYREEQVIPVRVRAMARFRITLEGPDGEDLPWMYQEFDIRTRAVWGAYRDDRPTSHGGYRLHTQETLLWEDRKRAADRYLSEQRLHLWELRGSLRKAVDADPIGFVNTLRRFEGLEEI
jgi:hypothetical protein